MKCFPASLRSCADVVEQAGILDGDDGLLRGVYVCVRTLRIAGCFQTKFYSVPEGGRAEISLLRVTARLCVHLPHPAPNTHFSLRSPPPPPPPSLPPMPP